ncbi:unnamed protein product, partial [Polarella glacialis]
QPPADGSVMKRIVVDGNTLVLTRFPDASWLGKRIETLIDVEEVFAALQGASGIGSRDDTDAGLLDCE